MDPILRVDRTTRQIRLGINRGCQQARVTSATLAIRRAGIWPQYETTYSTVLSECCGPQLVATTTEIDATLVTLTAVAIEGWVAVFEPTDEWLVDEPDGRYDAVLTTACGSVTVRFQKGNTARLQHASTEDPGCGDIASTCAPQAAAPGLVAVYTAIYRTAGHLTLPNGPFSTIRRQQNQAWGVVTAPADAGNTLFTQWSDGVLTRARDDGLATANRDVTANYAPTFAGALRASNNSTAYEHLLLVGSQVWWTTTSPSLAYYAVRITDNTAVATMPGPSNITGWSTGFINAMRSWVYDGTYVWWAVGISELCRRDPTTNAEVYRSTATQIFGLYLDPTTNALWGRHGTGQFSRFSSANPFTSAAYQETRGFSWDVSSAVLLGGTAGYIVATRASGAVQVARYGATGGEQVLTLTGGSAASAVEVLADLPGGRVLVFGDTNQDLWVIDSNAWTVTTRHSLAAAGMSPTGASVVRRYDPVTGLVWLAHIHTNTLRLLGINPTTGALVHDRVMTDASLSQTFAVHSEATAVSQRHVLTPDRQWMFTARHTTQSSLRGVVYSIALP